MKTSTITGATHDVARLAAREHVLRFLALAASDPAARRFEQLRDADFQELACAAARHLASDPTTRPDEPAPGEGAPGELDLAPIVRALDAPRETLVDDHVRTFGLVVSKECPPYEVQYCPQTFSIYRSQLMADIAGFYRAFGVEPGRDAPERVDHLASELEFQAWLVSKERRARESEGPEWAERAEVCRDAQREFCAEHLAWWVPAFATALERHAASLEPACTLHAALARALLCLVPVERAVLGVAPPDTLARPQADEEDAATACSGCAQDL